MRALWLVLLAGWLGLQAGMLDFVTLHEAKEAYAAKAYEKAAKLYEEAARKKKSDEALLNAGDAWYKAGRFDKALEDFRAISSPNLQFQKWHNLGNTYAQLGKLKEGIAAYEKALKIKEDKDTRFNLELLKKLLKEQQQKNKKQNKNQNDQKNRQNKQNKQNKQQQNQQQQNQQNQQNRQNGKGNEKRKNQEKSQKNENQKSRNQKGENRKRQNEEEKGKQAKEKNPRRDEARRKEGERKRDEAQRRKAERARAAMKEAMKKNEPISDMELRKWEKSLNRRGIHTLMLPLPTHQSERNENEKNPW